MQDVLIQKLALARNATPADAVPQLTTLLEVTQLAVRIMENPVVTQLATDVNECLASKDKKCREQALEEAIDEYEDSCSLEKLPQVWQNFLEHCTMVDVDEQTKTKLARLMVCLIDEVVETLKSATKGGSLDMLEASIWSRCKTALGLCSGVVEATSGCVEVIWKGIQTRLISHPSPR